MTINLLLQGRLGNNLFQLASLLRFKSHLQKNRCINIYISKNQLQNLNAVLNKNSCLFDLIKSNNLKIWEGYKPNLKMRLERKISKISNLDFPLLSKCINDENYLNKFQNLNHKKRLLIDGYFQFGASIDGIPWEEQFNFDLKSKNERLCLHVRRSDTFTNSKLLKIHKTPSYSFYNNALSIFSRRFNIKYELIPIDIYTDNKEWCKKVFKGMGDIKFCSTESPTEDFISMMNYKNYIISNSTFAFFPALVSNIIYKKNFTIHPTIWSNGKTFKELSLSKNNWIDI